MFSPRFSALVLVLLAVARTGSAQPSANCTLETASLATNDAINTQAKAIQQNSANQIEACIKDSNTNCDVSVDYSPYELACTNEGGVIYQPAVKFQCKNDGFTTSISQGYITCVGDSCDTAAFTDEFNEELNNHTTIQGQILATQGVECSAEFSGASQALGFAVSVAIMMGGMVMSL